MSTMPDHRFLRFVRDRVAVSMTALAFLLAGGGGCASTPPARAPHLDPSNPSAPVSPPLAVASLNVHVDEGGGERGAIIYTCPMHPEISSEKPGRCPKCGMKLVPKGPPEGKK